MIDCLYYINLDSRLDRKEHIESNVIPIFKKYVKEVKRFSAFDHTKYSSITQRAAGCSYSHLAIWNESIFEKYDKILIVEDDFEFIVNEETVNNVFDLLSKIDYNICNLGYVTTDTVHKTNLKYIHKCYKVQTTSCYAASPIFLEKMIPSIKESADNLMTNQEHHINAIDIAWQKFQTDPKWFISDRLGKQLVGHSDIENRFCNYAYAELR
tara:strand:- start:265 stop:897 length:633 start_codon:yes stop_codon:yes gene_type:complete